VVLDLVFDPRCGASKKRSSRVIVPRLFVWLLSAVASVWPEAFLNDEIHGIVTFAGEYLEGGREMVVTVTPKA
jgi:hypothetical protein